MFTTEFNKPVEVDRAAGAAKDIGASRASKPPSSQVAERGADVVAAALLAMQEGNIFGGRK